MVEKMLNKIRSRYNNMRIKIKLIILLLSTIIIPISILGIYSYDKILKTTNAEINNNFMSMVNQVTNNLNTILLSLPENAELIYGDKIIQKVLAGKPILSLDSLELQNEIINERISNNIKAATFLFAANGDIYTYNNLFYPDLSIDYRNTDEYKKCKSNDYKLIWIPTNHISIKSRFTLGDTKNMLGIALILKDLITREEVGMLESIIREDYIFNIYSKMKMTENTFGFIIDSEGYILSHQDKELLGTKDKAYTGIRDILYRGDQGSVSYKIDGSEHILLYGTIPINNWKLVFAAPKSEILKYSESTKRLFLTILIICSLISILISILVSAGISKPIEKIVSAIVKYGKGELFMRIRGYENRSDEVGTLSHELNQMAERITRLVQEKYYSEIKTKEAELKALQAQINPHFLYNTLDTINFLAIKHRVADISSIALALGDLMRISIRKDVNQITLREEIDYVCNYMTIQKVRFKDKLNLELKIEEELYDCKIPKLTLQPLVENALVHGIEEKIGKGSITILGCREGNNLVLSVVDDGIGLDEELINRILASNLKEYTLIKSNGLHSSSHDDYPENKGNSIGLTNVDMRIKLLFGYKYGLSIRSKIGEGTIARVILPMCGKITTQ